MGFVSGLLGGAGGAAGTGFAGPSSANVLNPTTVAQADTAYNQTQTGLQNQQAFLNATQAQNGLQNQSNVYGQLQNVAAGQGPNPAQAMLQQATGANVANQAALMAGQRGSGANAGLMARQAAMQGANTQQQAAGQAATMQANQSLGALGQAGAMANQQAAQQAAATNAYSQSAQAQQQNLLNSIAQQNSANVGMQSNINTANAGLASNVMGGQQNMLGNLTGALGSTGMLGSGIAKFATAAAADGGAVEHLPMMADGGMMQQTSMRPVQQQAPMKGPQSNVGRHMADMQTPPPISMPQSGTMMAKGGAVPALVSPGERYLPPSEVKKVVEGKKTPMQAGEKIPGTPKVAGAKNSYANDTVPKTLEEGGIVLPRSVTQSSNPEWAAHKFVRDVMAKKHRRG